MRLPTRWEYGAGAGTGAVAGRHGSPAGSAVVTLATKCLGNEKRPLIDTATDVVRGQVGGFRAGVKVRSRSSDIDPSSA